MAVLVVVVVLLLLVELLLVVLLLVLLVAVLLVLLLVAVGNAKMAGNAGGGTSGATDTSLGMLGEPAVAAGTPAADAADVAEEQAAVYADEKDCRSLGPQLATRQGPPTATTAASPAVEHWQSRSAGLQLLAAMAPP